MALNNIDLAPDVVGQTVPQSVRAIAFETRGARNYQVIALPQDKVIIDVASSSITYYGFAVPGTATSAASWKILRASVSGTVTTYSWADSDIEYDNIWDNRASLSYG